MQITELTRIYRYDGIDLPIPPHLANDPQGLRAYHATLYPAILIDLRELDSLSSSGLTALAAWPAETPWPPTVSALRDTRTTTALTAAGLTGTIPFAQPAA